MPSDGLVRSGRLSNSSVMITCCTAEAPTPHGAGRCGSDKARLGQHVALGARGETWRAPIVAKDVRCAEPALGRGSRPPTPGTRFRCRRDSLRWSASPCGRLLPPRDSTVWWVRATRQGWWRAASTGVCRVPTCSRWRRTSAVRPAPGRVRMRRPSARPTPAARRCCSTRFVGRAHRIPGGGGRQFGVHQQYRRLVLQRLERTDWSCRIAHGRGCIPSRRLRTGAPCLQTRTPRGPSTTQRARSASMPDSTESASTA